MLAIDGLLRLFKLSDTCSELTINSAKLIAQQIVLQRSFTLLVPQFFVLDAQALVRFQ